MDFYKILERSTVRGRGDNKEVVSIDIYPDFIVGRSKDLMIRGKSVYAVWDEEKGLWSQDEYDVQRIVDQDMYNYREKIQSSVKLGNIPINVLSMKSNKSKVWKDFKQYVSTLADNYHQLDEDLTFLNTEVKKDDYVSRRLPYSLEPGDYSAWDTLVSTLYDEEEREKIEWSIGAVVSGDSKKIQKFCVFYGEPGAGKGTIITIIQKLFDGYYTTFDAKSLGSSSNQFATEAFRSNPLVAIQHDGDLSRIEDNTRINSIVSHEMMTMKEKFKPEYMARANCFLFLGTNRPVRITDSRSGVIRRLIDIHPSNRKIPPREYDQLMSQIDFQLGAIAYHCLEVYKELGKNYYRTYIPKDMIMKTDVFYNFIESNIDIFVEQDGVTLKQAYMLYKEYCDDALVEFKLPMYKFREELKTYFEHFDDKARLEDGKQVRSWYSGFRIEKMKKGQLKKDEKKPALEFNETKSILDDILAECPAQYSTIDEREKPIVSWDKCFTRLCDLKTNELHYILPRDKNGKRIPIVMIDFDLKNEKGEKDKYLNLEAASKWPSTYGEFSKGGCGVHLVYYYNGDLTKLASEFAPGIEIKNFAGNSSMRRRLSFCNNIPFATLEEGALPLREEKMIDIHELHDQKHLINKIAKSLRKEDNVGGTKCEVEFIKKTLDDAYNSGMTYDVSDMRIDILFFAAGSTNNADYCKQLVNQMHFKSKDLEKKTPEEIRSTVSKREFKEDDPIVFFDIEIFRPTEPGEIDDDGLENEGLFLVCWTIEGELQEVHAMVNPKPHEIIDLFGLKLVGFNNRDYDNHMLFGRALGYTNAQLYDLSQRIIVEKARDAKFPQAFDISYTDVFDFSSKKQSLKKFEIDLGINHVENALPWDKPAPKSRWPEIIEYCKNDVIATEAVFNSRHEDWIARQILADIAGGKVNDTTNSLTLKIVFGNERHPTLVYTDLATGEQWEGR